MEQYQDQWVKGRNVGAGVRECESRYEALRPLLSQYTRPFTVLDLGASLGYFSFRIAEEFPQATIVAIDDDPRLFYQCHANEKPILHLRTRMREDDVWQLANCEQFDVVLALNVVHHFPRWNSVLRSLFRMGDHLIIETPHPEERYAINAENAYEIYFQLMGVEDKNLLCETPSHLGPCERPMWYFHTPNNTLRRAYFTAPDDLVLGGVTINSTFFQRSVTLHRKSETRDWLPGINLQTFLSLGGAFPLREDVARMVESFPRPAEPHGDVQPWNFVINNQGLHLIDGRDDRAVFVDDFVKVAKTIREYK